MPKIAISVNHNRHLHSYARTLTHTEQSTLGFTERQQQLQPQSKNHSPEEKQIKSLSVVLWKEFIFVRK